MQEIRRLDQRLDNAREESAAALAHQGAEIEILEVLRQAIAVEAMPLSPRSPTRSRAGSTDSAPQDNLERALADATTACEAAAQELEDVKSLISAEAVQFENQLQAAATKQRELDLRLAMYRGAVAHKQPSDRPTESSEAGAAELMAAALAWRSRQDTTLTRHRELMQLSTTASGAGSGLSAKHRMWVHMCSSWNYDNVSQCAVDQLPEVSHELAEAKETIAMLLKARLQVALQTAHTQHVVSSIEHP